MTLLTQTRVELDAIFQQHQRNAISAEDLAQHGFTGTFQLINQGYLKKTAGKLFRRCYEARSFKPKRSARV